jgi:hypothetical protein
LGACGELFSNGFKHPFEVFCALCKCLEVLLFLFCP